VRALGFTVIVVDDGSIDATSALAKEAVGHGFGHRSKEAARVRRLKRA